MILYFERLPEKLSTELIDGGKGLFGGLVPSEDGDDVIIILMRIRKLFYATSLSYLQLVVWEHRVHEEGKRSSFRRYFNSPFRAPQDDEEYEKILAELTPIIR